MEPLVPIPGGTLDAELPASGTTVCSGCHLGWLRTLNEWEYFILINLTVDRESKR